VNRTLDQVKTQIANKLGRERKTKEFDEWLKGLKDKANVSVDEKALEAVEVAAVQPGAAGHMGGIPMGPMGAGPHAAPPAPPPGAPAAPPAPAR
jgi:peptidyl-prolyl cis-trans isomerase C